MKQQRVPILILVFILSIVCSIYLVAYRIIPLYIIIAVVMVFSYTYYAILYIRPFEQKLYTPSNVVLIFLTVYSVAGIVVYYVRELYWFNYDGDMEIASYSALLAMWCVFAGIWVSKIRFLRKREAGYGNPPRQFQPKKLQKLLLVYIILGNLGSLVLFDFYLNPETIPLLADDTTKARVVLTGYSPGRGTAWAGLYLLMLAIPISYYYQRRFVKNTLQSTVRYLFKLSFCLIPLFLYSGRFYFLAPLLMLGAIHVIFIRHIRIWKLPLIFIALVVTAMFYSAWRTTGTLDLFGYEAIRFIWADIFPEMRSFATVVYYAGQPDVANLILLHIVMSWVPSAFFLFIGADKTEYFFAIGRYVAQLISPDTGISEDIGIRTGLVGEAYLAGGLVGVLVVFFLLGWLFGYLDRKFEHYTNEDARKLVSVLFAILLSLLVPYGTTLIITLGYMAVFLFITLRYAAPKTMQEHVGNRLPGTS